MTIRGCSLASQGQVKTANSDEIPVPVAYFELDYLSIAIFW
ncbi:hypothetical protein OROMI_007965 [Orobanche minor]